jgi:hypothetical protein
MIIENSSKQRTKRSSDSESDVLDGQVWASLAQWNDVAYNHLCEKINAACAQALYESAKDQNGSRVCSTTNCTSHGENGDGKHHGVLSAPDIAQLAVHWLEDCAGEEKGGSDPREIGSKVQRIRNSGKRSVGDTAFESREKKRDANGDKGSPETRTSLPRH